MTNAAFNNSNIPQTNSTRLRRRVSLPVTFSANINTPHHFDSSSKSSKQQEQKQQLHHSLSSTAGLASNTTKSTIRRFSGDGGTSAGSSSGAWSRGSSYDSSSGSYSGFSTAADTWNLNPLFGREKESRFFQELVETHGCGVGDKDNSPNPKDCTSNNHEDDDDMDDGAMIVILRGAAGSGKSALVQDQPWQERGWLMGSGKFVSSGDFHLQQQKELQEHQQSRSDTTGYTNNNTVMQEPYSALVEAMNQLADAWAQAQQQQRQPSHNPSDNKDPTTANAHNGCPKDPTGASTLSSIPEILNDDVEFLRHVLPKVYHTIKDQSLQQQRRQQEQQPKSSQHPIIEDNTLEKTTKNANIHSGMALWRTRRNKTNHISKNSSYPTKKFIPAVVPEDGDVDDLPTAKAKEATPVEDDQDEDTTNGVEEGQPPGCRRRESFSTVLQQDICTVDCIHATFVRILSLFCRSRPVVLYLHNVHLADAASSRVIQFFLKTIVSIRSSSSVKKRTRTATTVTQESHSPSRDHGSPFFLHKLLIILTYRDEEVDPNHPILQSIEQMKGRGEYVTGNDESKVTTLSTSAQQGQGKVAADDESNSTAEYGKAKQNQRIFDIEVKNLNVESVNSLVASLTKRSTEESLALSQVIHQKTHGNPFFVMHFLQMLRQEEFLRYSYFIAQWDWGDVDKLASAATVSDNVADVVASTLQRLPEATQVALHVAACLGKIIPLHVLVEWFNSHYDVSEEGLTCSVGLYHIKQQGLHAVLDNAVRVAILIRPKGQNAYSWAHDKLRTIAYSLIPLHQRPRLHLKLGRLLWAMSKKYPDEEWMIYMAAEQMNRYSEYRETSSVDSNDRLGNGVLEKKGDQEAVLWGAEVATLCLEAAKLSMSKSALYPAFDMLQAGLRHMQDVSNKWKEHYDLCLNLYSTVAELAMQLGKRDSIFPAIHEVENNARCFQDKFRVQMVQLKFITSGHDRNYPRGVDMAIEILKSYGVRQPKRVLPGTLLLECNKLRRRLPRRKLTGFLEMPTMTDPTSRKIMKLLSNCGMYNIMSPCDRNTKSIGWHTALKGLILSTEKGVADETATAIAMLGYAHRQQGNLKEANEYGELALKLLDRFPETVGSVHAAVISITTSGIFTSTKPLNKCLDLWLEVHHVGIRTGMTEKAGGAILSYALTYIACGLPLGPLLSDLREYEKEVIQFNLSRSILAVFKILQQFIENLQKSTLHPTLLKGDCMDAEELLSSFHGSAYAMAKRDIDTFRLLLALIFGELESAEALIADLEPFLEYDFFYVRSSLRRCTVALASFKISRRSGKRRLRQLARRLMKEYREKVKNGYVNAFPLLTMMEAEESPSKERYDRAIRICARLGMVHFEAYMCEQAGLFFLDVVKDDDWAAFYLAQAFYLHGDWGSNAKAERLKQEYPHLLQTSLRERVNTALKGRARYSSTHTDLLKDFDWERLSSFNSNSPKTCISDRPTQVSSNMSEAKNNGGSALVLQDASMNGKDKNAEYPATVTTDDASSDSGFFTNNDLGTKVGITDDSSDCRDSTVVAANLDFSSPLY